LELQLLLLALEAALYPTLLAAVVILLSQPRRRPLLTAYLAGIQVGESHWTLRQINQLLFLREMNRTGHFSEADRSKLH